MLCAPRGLAALALNVPRLFGRVSGAPSRRSRLDPEIRTLRAPCGLALLLMLVSRDRAPALPDPPTPNTPQPSPPPQPPPKSSILPSHPPCPPCPRPAMAPLPPSPGTFDSNLKGAEKIRRENFFFCSVRKRPGRGGLRGWVVGFVSMPFVMVTWVPKAARQSPEVRKAVAKAVIQALVGVQAAEVTPDKVGASPPPPAPPLPPSRPPLSCWALTLLRDPRTHSSGCRALRRETGQFRPPRGPHAPERGRSSGKVKNWR